MYHMDNKHIIICEWLFGFADKSQRITLIKYQIYTTKGSMVDTFTLTLRWQTNWPLRLHLPWLALKELVFQRQKHEPSWTLFTYFKWELKRWESYLNVPWRPFDSLPWLCSNPTQRTSNWAKSGTVNTWPPQKQQLQRQRRRGCPRPLLWSWLRELQLTLTHCL